MHPQFSWASAMHAKWADVILLLLIDGRKLYMHAAMCCDTSVGHPWRGMQWKHWDEGGNGLIYFTFRQKIYSKKMIYTNFCLSNHYKKLINKIKGPLGTKISTYQP